jgi:hypothetical protein
VHVIRHEGVRKKRKGILFGGTLNLQQRTGNKCAACEVIDPVERAKTE